MKVDDGVGAFELKTRVNSLFIMKKWLTAPPSTQSPDRG
jgi:hypothetical protein